jgi:hypothetical protein
LLLLRGKRDAGLRRRLTSGRDIASEAAALIAAALTGDNPAAVAKAAGTADLLADRALLRFGEAAPAPVAAALAAAGGVDRLFGALPSRERALTSEVGALLDREVSAGRLSGEAVLQALGEAADARLRHRGGGVAALWLSRLRPSLPAATVRALRDVIAEGPGDADGASAALAALERRARPAVTPAVPEPGSLAWVLALIEDGGRDAKRRLRAALRSPRLRGRLARALPERLLLRLAELQAPRQGASLLRAAEVVTAAMERCGLRADRQLLWDAVLAGSISSDPVGALAARLLAGVAMSSGKGGTAVAMRVAKEAAALASTRGLGAVKAALEECARKEDRRALPPRNTPAPAGKLWDKAPAAEGTRIALINAGLVLVSPFLPQLFDRLGLLAPDTGPRDFFNSDARTRGVHLLQFLVDGRCDLPEPLLVLNKLLCGLDPSDPVLAAIEPTAVEMETCQSLLEAMLASWPLMNGSSVAALRETFLAREGVAVRQDEGWRVQVERRTLDVLMERLPWSFSIILHPWMTGPITVEW